jgi:hypothetical protein
MRYWKHQEGDDPLRKKKGKKMKATWTKLREGFGVRVSGATPSPGQTIEVSKKSGGTSTVTIGRVIWRGKDKYTGEQVVLFTAVASRSSGQGRSSSRDEGWHNNGCSECRRLGAYCQSCAFDEFDC